MLSGTILCKEEQMGKMSKLKKYILPFLMTAIVAVMAACTGDSNSNNTTNPNASIFEPKGTVSGVLRDAVTLQPLAGAVVHIMDKTSTTDATGIFVIANVPALNGAGNEPTNTNAFYPLVIELAAVNAKLAAGAAQYPSIAYFSANVTYTSLGETSTAVATTSTNHDTPVDGFVANVMPTVGKLDAAIKLQVVDTKLAAVSGATVSIFTNGAAIANTTNNVTGATATPGHLIATKTTDATGFVTFSALEAKQSYVVKAVTADGLKEGWYGNYAGAGGTATPTAQVAATAIVAPTDGLTDVYAVQGGAAYDNSIGAFFSNALVVGTVDGIAPFILSSSPANLADIAIPATGTVDTVFTFSEPIQSTNYANAITRDLAVNAGGQGLYNDVTVSYLGPKAGNIDYSLAWNATRTTLTVSIPVTAMTTASRYSVSIAGALAKGAATNQLKDAVGNNFTAVPASATVAFTTSGGFNVAAPVIAKTNSNSSLAINWVPVSNAASYKIYISKVGYTPYANLGTAVNGTTVFGVTSPTTFNMFTIPGFSLANNVTYAIKITSVNGALSESAYSNEITFVDTPPTTPASFALSATAPAKTTDVLSWTQVANAVSYNVYLEKVTGGVGAGFTVVGTPTIPTFNAAATIAGAGGYANGQLKVTYNVYVTSVDQFGGESAASSILSISDLDAPTAVKALAAGGLSSPIVNAANQTVTYTITFNKNMLYNDLITTGNYTLNFPSVSSAPTVTVGPITGVTNTTATVKFTVANPLVPNITWTVPETLSCTAKSIGGVLAVTGTF
jgi:hypothetical protein